MWPRDWSHRSPSSRTSRARTGSSNLPGGSPGTAAVSVSNRSRSTRRKALHLDLLQLFPRRQPTVSATDPVTGPLSDPDTVFMLIKAKKAALPLELQRFLDRVAPMLEKGASAHDIARRTQMRLQDVQLALHGLKQARKAWPAFVGTTPPARPAGYGVFSWLLRPRAARAASG